MAVRRYYESDDVGSDRINTFVRMAAQPPEEELLQLHFKACSDPGDQSSSDLSRAQRRWVMSNLEANPEWQSSWIIREKSLGRKVSWNPPGTFRYGFQKARMSTRRRTAASLLVGALVYAALWFGGRATQPTTYAWASLERYEIHLDQEARGVGTVSQSAFARAAESLLAAPISIVGLFPHYDQTRVDGAAQYLTIAYATTSDPFQRAEIAFFLAKTSLMKNDLPLAIEWLERVQAQNVADYRVDSRLLLEAITAQV